MCPRPTASYDVSELQILSVHKVTVGCFLHRFFALAKLLSRDGRDKSQEKTMNPAFAFERDKITTIGAFFLPPIDKLRFLEAWTGTKVTRSSRNTHSELVRTSGSINSSTGADRFHLDFSWLYRSSANGIGAMNAIIVD